VIFVLMAAALMFSVSMPQSFGDRGAIFAASYVAMQVGRSAFMAWALSQHGEDEQRATFVRVTIWFGVTGVFWIVGAFAEGDLRIILWGGALLIEVAVPWIGFWLPGLGRSSSQAWDVEGEHLTERCALFIILALGESILVTGRQMTALAWDSTTLAAFATSFLSLITMWWIYFDTGARRGIKAFERAEEPGRLARFAYTYVHLPIVSGVVVVAVGDKLVLAHPNALVKPMEALVLLSGPALFLAGNLLFKNAIGRRWPLSHLIGLGLLLMPLPVLASLTMLALASWAVGAMLMVAVLERVFLRSREAARIGVN
jgi:low temperature requirement protein LtrA